MFARSIRKTLPMSKSCLISHGHYETEVNIRRYQPTNYYMVNLFILTAIHKKKYPKYSNKDN